MKRLILLLLASVPAIFPTRSEELEELFVLRLHRDRNNARAQWELLLGNENKPPCRIETEEIDFGGKEYTVVYIFAPIEWEKGQTYLFEDPVFVVSFSYFVQGPRFKELKTPRIIPRISRYREHPEGFKVYELLLYREFALEHWQNHKFRFEERRKLFSSREA